MVVSFGDGVTFVVVLHQVWRKHPVHQDFLGFYVVDSHRMSTQTHGLLGMQYSDCRLFSHKAAWEPHSCSPCTQLMTLHSAFASTLKGQWPYYPWQGTATDGVNVFIPRAILSPL
jgi:hypothetical protein